MANLALTWTEYILMISRESLLRAELALRQTNAPDIHVGIQVSCEDENPALVLSHQGQNLAIIFRARLLALGSVKHRDTKLPLISRTRRWTDADGLLAQLTQSYPGLPWDSLATSLRQP